MDIKGAVLLGIFAIVVIVPVVGVTARFALRPIVDAIVRLREAFGLTPAHQAMETRVLDLEGEVVRLRASVSALEETVALQQKLLAAPRDESAATSAPAPEG